jgi:ATP/ADP translocase
MTDGKEQHRLMAEETRRAHEQRHNETLAIIDNIVRDVKDKVAIQEQQIRSLENLKWWMLGAFAIITFILNYADLSVIFQK